MRSPYKLVQHVKACKLQRRNDNLTCATTQTKPDSRSNGKACDPIRQHPLDQGVRARYTNHQRTSHSHHKVREPARIRATVCRGCLQDVFQCLQHNNLHTGHRSSDVPNGANNAVKAVSLLVRLRQIHHASDTLQLPQSHHRQRLSEYGEAATVIGYGHKKSCRDIHR